MVHRKCYEIDGRTVNIIDKTKLARQRFEKYCFVIQEFCKQEEIATHFPRLIFILETESNDTFANVKPEDLIKGRYRVYINTFNLHLSSFNPQSDDKEKLYSFLAHELTHALTQLKALYYTYLLKVRAKQHKTDIDFLVPKGLSFEMISAKKFLFELFEKIYQEGLATYYQFFKKDKITFTKIMSDHLYQEAKPKAERYKESFVTYLKIESMKSKATSASTSGAWQSIKETRDFCYAIGLHVIYTLITQGEDNFPSLVNSHTKRTIKRYEQLMAKLGLQPLVSVKDKNAILCYKEMKQQWDKTAAHLEKKNYV